jgi:homoaconitate hydratase
MTQNRIEKIAQDFAVELSSGITVRSGDFIFIRPAYVMTHDNTGAVIPKFRQIGVKHLYNPNQIVFTLDHNIQDKSKKTIEKYAMIESFAKDRGIDLYPAGRGIGHQIMIEEGYVWPGTMVVASDSHANMYGAFGCLGTPVVRTDAAAIWSTGQTWWQIPPVAKVNLKGYLKKGVTGKDVIIALCGAFNNDEVLNHAIEFAGDGVHSLTIDQRLTISNMTTEWGALAGIFPVDEITIRWFEERISFIEKRGIQDILHDKELSRNHSRLNVDRIKALKKDFQNGKFIPDKNADYAVEIELDLDTIKPMIAGPHDLKQVLSAEEAIIRNIPIHKAYLLSCVNARAEDLSEAARILKGRKIADHVELYVAAASNEVQKESEKAGDWQTILDSGAIPLPPGCGPCIGLGKGLLKDFETGISATNRNFRGRMGSKNAEIYLASPAVVAQSALSGRIDILQKVELTHKKTNAKIVRNKTKRLDTCPVELIKDFPEYLKGDLLFCYADNLNTDGIFPGKYTYIDDLSHEAQANVVMENYDPDFNKIVRKGDFLVGGFNFGTGSSREQAVTALKYRGIQLIIAGSFNETYKRNALNNGLLVIEVPELVLKLKGQFGTDSLTLRTGLYAHLDIKNSVIHLEEDQYNISPVRTDVQKLILLGGLEAWIKEKMKND